MLTAKLKELRKSHITASEVPALFGEHLKLTGADLFLMKAFPMEDKDIHSAAVEIGEDFEGPLLRYAARELGVEIIDSSTDADALFRVHDTHPILSATLDALIVPQRKEAIEAKTTSMNDDDTAGKDNEWGASGTDIIPSRVILQCMTQIACHNLDRVHVIALLGRHGLRRELFKVERNDTIIKAIVDRAEMFWNTYIIPKVQPPELNANGEVLFGLGSIDIIKRVIRQPSTWAEVPDELILDWDAKRKARLEAQSIENEALERMLTPLKDSEGVHLSDGRTLEYLPVEKSILDQKKFKAEEPKLYEQYLRESVSRTPRLKELK